MAKHINAVAYVRWSSDDQDSSGPIQREAIERFAAESGYSITEWFTDAGLTGTNSNRPALQQMLTAIDSREIQTVIVYKIDRLTRLEPEEFNGITRRFKAAGCKLVSISEPGVDVTHAEFGWLFGGLESMAARAYAKSVSLRSLEGRTKSIKAGRWVSRIPFGYSRDADLHLHPIEDQAETVRFIFKRYVDGLSWARIAKELNTEGTPSPSGGMWSGGSIKGMLENPAYIGHTPYGRVASGKFNILNEGNVKQVERSGYERREAAQILIENTHQAIISTELWDAVQEARQQRTQRKTVAGKTYAFSGVFRCGSCGAPMKVAARGGVRYTCCNWADGSGRCNGTSVKESDVMDALARAIESFAQVPDIRERIEAEIRRMTACNSKQPTASNRKAKQLTEKIAKARGNLVLLDAENIPAAQERIRQMETQLRSLTESDTGTAEVPDVSEALAVLDSLVKAVNASDPALQNRLFRKFFGQVTTHTVAKPIGKNRRRHILKQLELLPKEVSTRGNSSQEHLAKIIVRLINAALAA